MGDYIDLSEESGLVDQVLDILLDSNTDVVRSGRNELTIFKDGSPFSVFFFIQDAGSLVVSLSNKKRVRKLLYDYNSPSLKEIRKLTLDLLLNCRV